jgi:hypothetical protein
MTKRLRLLLLVLVATGTLAAAAFLPARAAAEPRVTVSAYGRYEVRSSGTSEKAERTVAGEVRPVATKKLIEKTDVIVGQLGITFGMEIDLDGFPPGPVLLTIRTIHPKLTNDARGVAMTVSEFDWPVAERRGVYFGFTFDHRWEIAEGEWTKQIVYQGRVLAEKKFKVVVPIN